MAASEYNFDYRGHRYTIDLGLKDILRDQKQLNVTAQDFKLALYFVIRPKTMLDKEKILRENWDTFVEEGIVHTYVNRLRGIFSDPKGKLIVSRKKKGYCFMVTAKELEEVSPAPAVQSALLKTSKQEPAAADAAGQDTAGGNPMESTAPVDAPLSRLETRPDPLLEWLEKAELLFPRFQLRLGLGALMFWLGGMTLLVGCEVHDLRTFEIQGVVHPRESRYEISCWSLDFSETSSQVHLQVFDRETPHEFLKFRFEEIEKYSNLLLIPKKSGDLNTARKYKLLNIKRVPNDVLFPTPQSKNIAAFITLEFEPLTKGEPNEIVPGPLEVNEAWLQFEDFPPLKLLRNKPVMWAWDTFLLNHVSKRDAAIMTFCGLLGILAPLGSGVFALLIINLSGKVETRHKASTEKTSSESSTSAVDGKACASVSSAEAAEDIGDIGRGDWI